MRIIVTTILLLISVNIFGQHLEELGMNDDPILTQAESEFLNNYMNDTQRSNFDFTGKKVIFVTGNSGRELGTKSKYFDQIKEWNKNGNKIATWVVVLNENEKGYSGGYDVIVTYWVKLFTERRKQKIIKSIKASS